MASKRFRTPFPSRSVLLICLVCLTLVGTFTARQVRGGAFALPLVHPDEGDDLRQCLDCHDSEESDFPFERFSHGLLYAERHGGSARGHAAVCAMCHQERFCSDCHGIRPGLKPSLKNSTDTRRRMPHRGDYLTRHRIDGRIDPTACFRCHGSPKRAKLCAPCHR
ncbi:MAG: hypothetical protein QNJ22_16230 [Desulfosarcinaceae bacterium]|nr:hypothetical protein [Desulfosarcinaceae bacterium]